MRRVIDIDIHRTFGEVVIWESGMIAGRVDMTRIGLEGFGKRLQPTDEWSLKQQGPFSYPSRHNPVAGFCAATPAWF
jgi:hypothetical protein